MAKMGVNRKLQSEWLQWVQTDKLFLAFVTAFRRSYNSSLAFRWPWGGYPLQQTTILPQQTAMVDRTAFVAQRNSPLLAHMCMWWPRPCADEAVLAATARLSLLAAQTPPRDGNVSLCNISVCCTLRGCLVVCFLASSPPPPSRHVYTFHPPLSNLN